MIRSVESDRRLIGMTRLGGIAPGSRLLASRVGGQAALPAYCGAIGVGL
jgi:hypothetical protein